MKRTLLILIALVSMSSLAFAQQQNGDKHGKPGKQQGQKQKKNVGGNSIGALISRQDVQTELKITPDQKSKLAEAMPKKEHSDKNSQENKVIDKEANKKLQSALEAKIKEILDDPQEKRLNELMVQRQGMRAVFEKSVATKISLTKEQENQLNTARRGQRDEQQAIVEKLNKQEISKEEAKAARQKLDDALEAEIGKMLTDKQKSDLKALGGASFKFAK